VCCERKYENIKKEVPEVKNCILKVDLMHVLFLVVGQLKNIAV